MYRRDRLMKKKWTGSDRSSTIRNNDAVRDVCGRYRTSEECSGMFQERSACLTPVGEASGGQYRVSTRTSDGIGRHMYAQHHHHPHPLLLHGRSQAPLPRTTDMTPGSGSASPVRSSSMRTGTAREKSRSGCSGGGCAAEGSFEACRHKSLEQRKILSRS